jgi:C-terminal processing protease CtpA/Prc
MRILSAAFLLVSLAAPLGRPALAQSVPANPGFEEGAPALVGWWHRPTPQYAMALDSVEHHEGRWAARLTGEVGTAPNTFGNVMQRTAAAPYQGKRVRYRAWVRTDLLPGASLAALWLRVDRPNEQMGFFDNMRERPIVGRTGWQAYEIVGDVAPDAQEIYFGMMLVGAGQAWVDQASFEVVGDAAPAARAAPSEPARPVTERGLENLAAFTRLLGYVRYFHPSDRAAATDWNAFAAAGVRAVEGAPNAARLAAVLDSLFRPIAPTVVVRVGDPRPAARDGGGARGDSIRWWRHQGVGMRAGEPSVYQSVRVSLPAAGALPDSVPDPLRPLPVRLGAGVSALVPLAVYADGQGTLPHAAAPAAAGASGPATGDDRATRLADVALGWNVFQHFYPYFDVTEVDWAAELRTALRAAATDAGECAFLTTLRRMVAALDDGHGGVYHGCEGPRRAPLVQLESVEGRPTITAVGSGVEGVRAGDVVLRVDGLSADSLLRARGELVSSATPQWRQYLANALLLTGRDSLVRVTVQRAAGDTGTVRLRRGPPTEVHGPKPEPVAQLRPGIWYVDLDRVTDAQLQAALPELERAAGLVFDLRGYPDGLNPFAFFSHLIREPANSARWNVPVVTRPDHVGWGWRTSRWELRPAAPYLAAPRVFITDGRAISYAESVMGIVEAYRLGEIVGETTAGTNGNVNPFTLPGGYGVSWTGMQVLKHDGSRHHGVGIHPTVPAHRTRAGVAAGRDELLERAVEVVTRARTP